MGHRLQAAFATAQGEADYSAALAALIVAGQLHAADTMLMADLATLDTELAQHCMATTRDRVTISGWRELVDAIAAHEGEPITGLTIGMGNEPDLVFEGDAQHAPFLTLGIYADGAFAFSGATREGLLAQCQADVPLWADSEEDIEVYLELDGLAPVNTALIRHKHRFFLRDGDPAEAPLPYVECVLAGWFRALRFHQAVAAEIEAHGLPGHIPVISGIFDMRPDVATVHWPEAKASISTGDVAPLVIKPKVQRVDVITDLSGATIRKRVIEEQPASPPRRGFFARMFGRG